MTKIRYTWGNCQEIVAGRSNQHTCSKVKLPLFLTQKGKPGHHSKSFSLGWQGAIVVGRMIMEKAGY